MKLIELLVKKHNEEGWEWPENADMAEAFPHEKGWVNFWFNNESTSGGFSVRDWCPPQVDAVKHEQYEAALAASKEMLINKPDADGWITWSGGECPVSRETLVDCKRADGDEYDEYPAKCIYWHGVGEADSIIAYRLHKPEAEQPVWNGEGLPPVGQRCDFYSALEGRWLPVQIEAVTKDGVAFTWLTDELCYSGLDCVNTENALFRAPLSAEELARIGVIDNFIKIMAGYIDGGLKPEIMRERLYQHLPLLPGVKVEAPDA